MPNINTTEIKEGQSTLIYPPELDIDKTTDTSSSASFLDLYLEF